MLLRVSNNDDLIGVSWDHLYASRAQRIFVQALGVRVRILDALATHLLLPMIFFHFFQLCRQRQHRRVACCMLHHVRHHSRTANLSMLWRHHWEFPMHVRTALGTAVRARPTFNTAPSINAGSSVGTHSTIYGHPAVGADATINAVAVFVLSLYC